MKLLFYILLLLGVSPLVQGKACNDESFEYGIINLDGVYFPVPECFVLSDFGHYLGGAYLNYVLRDDLGHSDNSICGCDTGSIIVSDKIDGAVLYGEGYEIERIRSGKYLNGKVVFSLEKVKSDMLPGLSMDDGGGALVSVYAWGEYSLALIGCEMMHDVFYKIFMSINE